MNSYITDTLTVSVGSLTPEQCSFLVLTSELLRVHVLLEIESMDPQDFILPNPELGVSVVRSVLQSLGYSNVVFVLKYRLDSTIVDDLAELQLGSIITFRKSVLGVSFT